MNFLFKYLQVARKSTYKLESGSSSESDFDEDPDKIEVPGKICNFNFSLA